MMAGTPSSNGRGAAQDATGYVAGGRPHHTTAPRFSDVGASTRSVGAAQARRALREVWLLAANYSPAEFAERLPAAARAEFIEHGPELESL